MGKLISRQAKQDQKTIVQNLRARIEEKYPNMSLSEAYRCLGRDAGGFSLSTVQRAMSLESGPSIHTISAFCTALGCTLHDVTAPIVHPVRKQRIRVYIDQPLPPAEPE